MFYIFYVRNTLLKILIIILAITAFGLAQLNLNYNMSISNCHYPEQVTFHPTDSNLAAIGCYGSSPYIYLLNLSTYNLSN